MSAALSVVGARVDALTVAFRVRLDPEFVAALRRGQGLARKHGRYGFKWHVEVPDTAMGDVKGALKLGPRRNTQHAPLRARWANDFDRIKRRSALWGELRHTKQRGVYHLTNEPYFRMQIQEHAPGGGKPSACGSCSGTGWVSPSIACPSVLQREVCPACDGDGSIEDPGYTLEIIWYAQELAHSGLERCLEESSAIAAQCGEVLQWRLRRLDLCADIAGWHIGEKDLWCLDKRPRAKWALNPVVANDHRGVDSYGTGAGEKRRITGIAVGRGGALMSRIYDKRNELELDTRGERREVEEARWRANGWDGETPVARVEFQLRGAVLTELGIRDPDACLEPLIRHDAYTSASGRERIRANVVGHKLITITEDGKERQATLVDRLGAIWSTCLDWVRIVTPGVTKSGKPKSITRCEDDPRWALLRTVQFNEKRLAPIKRYRPRAAASAAQALGVTLSQAGRDGRLAKELSESLSAYENDPKAYTKLLGRVRRLKIEEAHRVTRWLIDRFGGVAAASVHFAVRQNAARLRFYRGVEEAPPHLEARPPPLIDFGQAKKVA